MKKVFSKVSPVIWFVLGALVVGGGGTAYAANGGTFRLGATNSATKTTILTNTKGTALRLNAPSTKAPLSVGTNKTKVPNLNADYLDGKSSAAFVQGKIYFAEVNADGTLHRGTSGVTSSNTGTGAYQVLFPQAITSCFGQVSVGQISQLTSTPAVIIGASERIFNDHGVYVNTQDNTASPKDASFTLTVFCL